MRIWHFTESYEPYLSGVALSVGLLKKAQEARGDEVWVVAPQYPNHVDSRDHVFRLPSIPSPYPGFRIALPWQGLLQSHYLKHPPDIIHSHSTFGLGRRAAQFAKKWGIPLAFTIHTRFEHYVHHLSVLPPQWARKGLERWLKRTIQDATVVIAPSDGFAREVAQQHALPRVYAVPTAIDFPTLAFETRSNVRRKLGVAENVSLFLVVGRISPEKNIQGSLDAFSEIAKKRPDVHLLVVGDGPDRPRLMEKYRKEKSGLAISWAGLAPRVSRPGSPSVFEYYAASDLFLFTSLTETQGLVLPEAMGMGLPVLALESSAAREAIDSGKTGYIGDGIPSLVDQAVHWIDRIEERHLVSHHAMQFAREKYDLTRYAEMVEAVYRSVL